MRTLQEKYNAINEGNFSKDQFLRDARMQLPNLVTQYNGYDDAVQILKNRGMIQEIASFAERFKEYSDDALADIIINLSRYEGNEKDIEPVKAELARRKGNVAEISADTFKSAVDVARGRGEDRRASNLGSTFLNSFVGKLLMGGTISRIDIQKPSFGDYFDVTLEVLVPTQGTDGMYDKPKYLYYDVENDDWGMKGKGLEVTRQDARVLSQIAIKVNPDTKYRQGTQHFDIVGMNEARVEEVTPAQEKYRVKPSFKQEIAAAKKMIDAGKSEKEVVAKYGQAAFNAVNAQNLGETKLTEAKVYSFTLTYNDAKYVQRVLDNAGVDAVAKAGTFDDEVTIRAFDGMGLRRAKQALEADHFDINENVSEARLTNKSLTDYRYKPTNDMDKYPYEQILRGLRVELEVLEVLGTPTPEQYTKALAKVLKNLEKDTIFYTNQVAGISKKVDLHDKMVDVKKDNTVDKFNGMKKAELKEAIKGVIKNILSENSDPDLYDQDEERDGRRFVYNDQGDFGLESEFGDSFDNLDPDFEGDIDEDVYEMFGEDEDDEIDYDDENFSDPFIDGDLDESKTGDLHILAQESDTLRTFLKAVKSQYPDMDLNKAAQGLQFVWNNRNQGMDESVSLKDIL